MRGLPRQPGEDDAAALAVTQLLDGGGLHLAGDAIATDDLANLLRKSHLKMRPNWDKLKPYLVSVLQVWELFHHVVDWAEVHVQQLVQVLMVAADLEVVVATDHARGGNKLKT